MLRNLDTKLAVKKASGQEGNIDQYCPLGQYLSIHFLGREYYPLGQYWSILSSRTGTYQKIFLESGWHIDSVKYNPFLLGRRE